MELESRQSYVAPYGDIGAPAFSIKRNKYTNTQIHKYTNTQIHKYTNTNTQIHKYTTSNTNSTQPLPIIPIRQGTL